MHSRYPGRERLRSFARAGVTTVVVISPWLFGSADPWAFISVCLLANLAIAAWLLSVVFDPRPHLRASSIVAVLLMLGGYVAVQGMPLPARVVERVAPRSAQAQVEQAELFAATEMDSFLPADHGTTSRAMTLSVSGAATWRSLCLFGAYVGVFVVFANAFKGRSELRTASTIIVTSCFLMAVIGMAQEFSGSDKLLWFHVPRFGGSIFGPFTNRNHFAAHMNMAFGLAVALLLVSARRREWSSLNSWRDRIAWLSSRHGCRVGLLAFAAAVMAASVCVSLSRGGISSLAIAFGASVAAMSASREMRGRRRWVMAVVLLALGAVVWLGWRPVVGRLGTLADLAHDAASNSRTVATRDTLRMFADAPVLGWGFGSFQEVFPRYQHANLDKRWLHAHNDYAQLLAEGGLVGALLWLLAVGAFVVYVVRAFPRASSEGRLMTYGLSVSVGALCMHSLVDYSLHKPANAFLFAAIGGLMVTALQVTRRRDHAASVKAETAGMGSGPRPHEATQRCSDSLLRRTVARLSAVVALALVLGASLVQMAELRGEFAFARFNRLGRLAEKGLSAQQMLRVVEDSWTEARLVRTHAWRNADALWQVSRLYLRWSRREDMDLILTWRLREQAVRFAALAVRIGPADYLNWVRLATAMEACGLSAQADVLLQAARELAPEGLDLRFSAPEPEPVWAM